jgi:hypothetical protein
MGAVILTTLRYNHSGYGKRPTTQQHPGATECRDQFEVKEATSMTETPNNDQPGFVAEAPDHCHACYRFIQPGQTYYLTIGQAILCEGCIPTADAIRVADDLVVVVEDGRLVVRRGDAAVEVLPREVRRLVDALVEAAAQLVDGQSREV